MGFMEDSFSTEGGVGDSSGTNTSEVLMVSQWGAAGEACLCLISCYAHLSVAWGLGIPGLNKEFLKGWYISASIFPLRTSVKQNVIQAF